MTQIQEQMEKQLLSMQIERSLRAGLPQWRSEAYVDRETGLVQQIRKWQRLNGARKPDATLIEEQRFYYQPRVTDADHFDTNRITSDVKLLYGTSKP
ncbi:MAG: hypothetical protein H8F28_21295 [Fibrella sp.]|nr:hypothetical protein [Armatimonadota bacterium]